MAKKRAREKLTEDQLAERFGVSARQVRNWKKSGWWSDDFGNPEDGYDVAAIRAAYNDNKELDELEEQRRQLRLERDQAERDIRLAELRAKQRAEARELGNTLPADVYAEFVREVLGMMRASIEELPQRFAKECPAKLRPLVWVEPRKVKRERDAGKLQRMCNKIVRDFEKWLTADPEEETKK